MQTLKLWLITYCAKNKGISDKNFSENFPYVLNPLILLKLVHKFMSCAEINNNNINSKLQ